MDANLFSHPEHYSDIPELQIPDFECSIPEIALKKMSPDIAEMMKMQNITMQYSKWQCTALAQIHMQVRKTNGKVAVLDNIRRDNDGDHEKVTEMNKLYQKICDWKVLVVTAGIFIMGLTTFIWYVIDLKSKIN